VPRIGCAVAGRARPGQALAVWWTARCSLLKRGQHLLSESEALLRELPLELIERLPAAQRVRPRPAALPRVTRRRRFDPPTAARAHILAGCREEIANLDAQDRQITRQPSSWHRAARRSTSCGALDRVGRRVAGRGRRPTPVHRRRVRSLQRHRAAGRLDRRGTRRACPSPLQPRWQPPHQESSTGSPSPNCAASRAPSASTPTRARTATPRRRPAAAVAARPQQP